LLGLVVVLAVVFCGYLVLDGLYHRRKWKRLRRKFQEAGNFEPEEASGEQKPPGEEKERDKD